MFSSYHSKGKETALLIIFLSQSHQFPTRCLYQKYFLIGGSGGLFLSRVPQLGQIVKLICQNTTYTSHKMQIRDQSKFRRDIRAKLLHEVCITGKLSFHFYFPHDSFLSHQPRRWCCSCYLTMQLEQEEAMDLCGLTISDTLGHRKYHWQINHCSYKTKTQQNTPHIQLKKQSDQREVTKLSYRECISVPWIAYLDRRYCTLMTAKPSWPLHLRCPIHRRRQFWI